MLVVRRYDRRVPRPHPTWIVAPLSLILGFGVADLTGVRPLGGVVLFLAALWCGLEWRRERGLPVALLLVAVYLLAFGLSHPLGKQVGTWPSVFAVSAIVGGVIYAVMKRHPRTAL